MDLDNELQQAATQYPDLFLARVSMQTRGFYRVITASGEIRAETSGKIGYLAGDLPDYPAVGDWVMVDRLTNLGGNAIIRHILPRRTAFIRKAAGTAVHSQVIAANIDTVFICMSLNHDFNLRRLERYLAITWDSGAAPVVMLTKADLCAELELRRAQIRTAAIGVDILATSSHSDVGYAAINNYLHPGTTIAFIGSSGVGKSTLINRLLGKETLATQGIDADDKGRHTTTFRQLIPLPGGAVVIDTPGMRELQLESADLSQTFADIDELAAQCRFADCAHEHEPGCAVAAAVVAGKLSPERLRSYLKLRIELAYQGLSPRQLEQEKLTRMMSGMGGIKQARAYAKEKNRRR